MINVYFQDLNKCAKNLPLSKFQNHSNFSQMHYKGFHQNEGQKDL